MHGSLRTSLNLSLSLSLKLFSPKSLALSLTSFGIVAAGGPLAQPVPLRLHLGMR